MESLSDTLLKTTLVALRQGLDLPKSPLLELNAVKRLVKGTGGAHSRPQTALRQLLKQVAAEELNSLRAIYPGQKADSGSHTATAYDDFEQRLAEDFRRGNRDLEAWSCLFHRYLSPELDLQVQQIARITSTNSKYIDRRLERGVRLLTEAIAARETESIQRATLQRQRLVSNLAGVLASEPIGRERELETLSTRLTAQDGYWIISLEGIGGIGKTTLAYSIVSERLNDHSFEGLACLTAKREVYRGGRIEALPEPGMTPERLVDELIEQLEFGEAVGSRYEAKVALLRRRLHQAPYLIVLDNLETIEDYEQLAGLLPDFVQPTKILITSRHRLRAYDYISCLEVNPLSEDATIKLVRRDALERNLAPVLELDDKELAGIHGITGGNPLAIKLLVGLLTHYPLTAALESLARASEASVEELYRFIYWHSWQLLSSPARDILLTMPLFAVGGTKEAIMWNTELSGSTFDTGMRELISLSLVGVRGPSSNLIYSIHPLTHRFLLAEVKKWMA